jgi:hypothetical protein
MIQSLAIAHALFLAHDPRYLLEDATGEADALSNPADAEPTDAPEISRISRRSPLVR